ncbi:MAG: alkaline phosphatase family protein [Chitinophagaceae bacterium]|nr:alkaline phosphatase family protein [Chitinophagaceae bacterium]
MKKIIPIVLAVFSCIQLSLAQSSNAPDKPKLVVGIVIDQMRYDFIWRFWDLYGDGGFKRLVNEGFLCRNTHYNYFLTTTAPGHSTIYTGTTPAIHGIIDNNWFDRNTEQEIYCVSDPLTTTVGNEVAAASASPFLLETSTITDELKLVSRESKVIGIALKDRAAIMPAGHLSNGSFWFDSKTGNWITSTFYMKTLPAWMEQFNKSHKPDSYLQNDWRLLLPRKDYSMCTNDTVPYESNLPGETMPIFPHRMVKKNYALIPVSPFGNTMTKDVAIEAIKGEQMGKHASTDFLCISFSSTDIIGHSFGPNSLETADCYARLDRDIEALLKFIDEYAGKNNVLVFLTADHGVALNPLFAKDKHLAGSFTSTDSVLQNLNNYLSSVFGTGKWINSMSSQQIYLNKKMIATSKFSEESVALKVRDYLIAQPGTLCVCAPDYGINNCAPFVQNTIMNGYQPARSGDILYSLSPGWVEWHQTKGTSHGTVYDYDNHVPLIWYGWKIAHGTTADPLVVPDIAPTISNWLNISYPSGCTGKPITGIIMK